MIDSSFHDLSEEAMFCEEQYLLKEAAPAVALKIAWNLLKTFGPIIGKEIYNKFSSNREGRSKVMFAIKSNSVKEVEMADKSVLNNLRTYMETLGDKFFNGENGYIGCYKYNVKSELYDIPVCVATYDGQSITTIKNLQSAWELEAKKKETTTFTPNSRKLNPL